MEPNNFKALSDELKPREKMRRTGNRSGKASA